jgi:hypothetical protein
MGDQDQRPNQFPVSVSAPIPDQQPGKRIGVPTTGGDNQYQQADDTPHPDDHTGLAHQARAQFIQVGVPQLSSAPVVPAAAHPVQIKMHAQITSHGSHATFRRVIFSLFVPSPFLLHLFVSRVTSDISR